MQISVVGPGKIGGNIALRLTKAGHCCLVFDIGAKQRNLPHGNSAKAAEALVTGLNDWLAAVWPMLPAVEVTETTVEKQGGLMAPDDIINGGHSYDKDNIRRAKMFAAKNIRCVDSGTPAALCLTAAQIWRTLR